MLKFILLDKNLKQETINEEDELGSNEEEKEYTERQKIINHPNLSKSVNVYKKKDDLKVIDDNLSTDNNKISLVTSAKHKSQNMLFMSQCKNDNKPNHLISMTTPKGKSEPDNQFREKTLKTRRTLIDRSLNQESKSEDKNQDQLSNNEEFENNGSIYERESGTTQIQNSSEIIALSLVCCKIISL